MRRNHALVLVLGLAAFAVGATPADLRELLDRLPPASQAVLRHNLDQWDAWTPAQRDAFRQRAAQWDLLPRAERDRRREQYHAWQALPAAERSQIQLVTTHYAAMPPDVRAAWRAQFDALDRSDQRGWLLGPSLGADYARLQPLLAQAPEAQREPLLRVLQAMPSQQRHELGVLAQRTPPDARDKLRRELLAVSPAERSDWLWRRLQR